MRPIPPRRPFSQRRPPGPLLFYGRHRPTGGYGSARSWARQFAVALADCQDAKWQESTPTFCYELACLLLGAIRKQTGEGSGPPAPAMPEFEATPFSALSLALDQVELETQRIERHVFLILSEYDQFDQGFESGRLSVEILNTLRHIIQHRNIPVCLAGSQPPRALVGADWTDYLINVRALECAGH